MTERSRRWPGAGCYHSVATDPAIQAFLDPVLSIDLDDAMALCEKGLDGPALAEFFEEGGAAVKVMTGVERLEGCASGGVPVGEGGGRDRGKGAGPRRDRARPADVREDFVEMARAPLREGATQGRAKDSGDDDLMELFGGFLDPDSSDSESDDGDNATADEGGATKVLGPRAR